MRVHEADVQPDMTTLDDLTYTYDSSRNRFLTGRMFPRTNMRLPYPQPRYNTNDRQTAFSTTSKTYGLTEDVATVTDANGA